MYMLRIHLLLVACTLGLIHSGTAIYQGSRLRARSSSDNVTISAANGPQSRNVHVVTDIFLYNKATSGRTGKPVYGGHSQIQVDGTSAEGPLIIQLDWIYRDRPAKLGIDVKDLGVANSGKIIPQRLPFADI